MKLSRILFLALVLFGVVGLRAQTVVQTVNFSESDTFTAVTSSVQLVDSSFFIGTFDPFDDSLGTLTSYVIEWNLTNTGTGSFGGSGGSLSVSVVGSLTLNGNNYDNGVTGGNGTGGGPSQPFSVSASIERTNTFLVSEADTEDELTYLTAVTGANTFTLGYTAPVNFSIGFGSATFDASTSGSVTLTYNYTAVPEPSTYAAIIGALALGFVTWRRRSAA